MANIDLYKQKLVNIAAAIRNKNGESGNYTLAQMPDKIRGLSIRPSKNLKVNPFPLYRKFSTDGNADKFYEYYSIPSYEMENISKIKFNGRIFLNNNDKPAEPQSSQTSTYAHLGHIAVKYIVYFTDTNGRACIYDKANDIFIQLPRYNPNDGNGYRECLFGDSGSIGYNIEKYTEQVAYQVSSNNNYLNTKMNDYEANIASIVTAAKNNGYTMGFKGGFSAFDDGQSHTIYNNSIIMIVDVGIMIWFEATMSSNGSKGCNLCYGWTLDKSSATDAFNSSFENYPTFTDIGDYSPQIEIIYK